MARDLLIKLAEGCMNNSDSAGALDYFPESFDYQSLRDAAGACRGCHLYKLGTQTVFGEGDRRAELMFVGEQPGDEEDKVGRPFVGPAGRLFDSALSEAGIDRSKAYVTNVVKHFSYERSSQAQSLTCPPILLSAADYVDSRRMAFHII